MGREITSYSGILHMNRVLRVKPSATLVEDKELHLYFLVFALRLFRAAFPLRPPPLFGLGVADLHPATPLGSTMVSAPLVEAVS